MQTFGLAVAPLNASARKCFKTTMTGARNRPIDQAICSRCLSVPHASGLQTIRINVTCQLSQCPELLVGGTFLVADDWQCLIDHALAIQWHSCRCRDVMAVVLVADRYISWKQYNNTRWRCRKRSAICCLHTTINRLNYNTVPTPLQDLCMSGQIVTFIS